MICDYFFLTSCSTSSPPRLLWLPCSWHFPTFTPLLKELGAICSLIGRILLFVQQMSHSSVKSGLVFPHYLLIRCLPEISIFCWLRSDLQINICLPPPLLFPGSLCFARLTFWEWELRLTNCSALTVLSTCTHLCEKQTKLKSSLDAMTPPIRHICSCKLSLGASLPYFILVHILYPHELWSINSLSFQWTVKWRLPAVGELDLIFAY